MLTLISAIFDISYSDAQPEALGELCRSRTPVGAGPEAGNQLSYTTKAHPHTDSHTSLSIGDAVLLLLCELNFVSDPPQRAYSHAGTDLRRRIVGERAFR